MYLMFGDEADSERGRGQKFFVCGAVTPRYYPTAQIRQGADRESATTRLEGGVHSRRAGAVGHNTEREASCDQDNPNTSADLEPVKVAIVVSQL